MTRRPAQHRAFTLLELTCATAVAALIAMALYSSLRVAKAAVRSSQRAVEPAQVATIAADIVRHDLESVLRPKDILAGAFYGVNQTVGDVQADSMAFTTVGRDAGDDGPFSEGARQIEILLDNESKTLIRRVNRNVLAPVQVEPPDSVLCRNVASFSLRFFDGAEWLEDWDSTVYDDVLPLGVEIDLTVIAASGQPFRVVRVVPIPCGRIPPAEEEEEQ